MEPDFRLEKVIQMNVNIPLIATGNLVHNSLNDRVAIVSGGGKGIGFEASRALAWLGVSVIIAEIDKNAGRKSAEDINYEMGDGRVTFFHTDVGDEGGVEHLKFEALRRFGRIDIVLNNATVAPLGAVKDKPISDWDRSYRVNLRGPVLLARACLPDMLKRNSGVFVCVSSFGGAYMAAYECFKRAQVVLADTLAEELADTGISVFTISPGMVLTRTLQEGVEQLAPLYGKTREEFIGMNSGALLSVEAAGAGFASAIALAEQFRGQEITAVQALKAAGIAIPENRVEQVEVNWTPALMDEALDLCREVRRTLFEQSEGWKKRALFERRWVINDFSRHTGRPVEKWLESLETLENTLATHDLSGLSQLDLPVIKIAHYWKHQAELAKGYTRNPDELRKQLEILGEWQETADKLAKLISKRAQ